MNCDCLKVTINKDHLWDCLYVCVCEIVPVQTALQSRGHPGTRGPQWARTVGGRLLPAGGGGWGDFSPGKDLRETQEETQEHSTEKTCGNGLYFSKTSLGNCQGWLFHQVCFPFCRVKVSWWRVKKTTTTPWPIWSKVYIPLEAQRKDVNFLYPERVWELQTTHESETQSAERGHMFHTRMSCLKKKKEKRLHTVCEHKQNTYSLSHLFLTVIICQVFPDCSYQLDNVFFPEPLFSQLCAGGWCMCVIDNKGMSSRPESGQMFIREAGKVTLDLPLYCLFSTLG